MPELTDKQLAEAERIGGKDSLLMALAQEIRRLRAETEEDHERERQFRIAAMRNLETAERDANRSYTEAERLRARVVELEKQCQNP